MAQSNFFREPGGTLRKPKDSKAGGSGGFFEDSHQTLWMTTERYVYRLPLGARKFEKTTLFSGPNTRFTETADGVVWIADRFGLRNAEEPAMPNGYYRTVIPLKDQNAAYLFSDRSGAIWFVGAATGITRIDKPSQTLNLPRAAQQTAMENFSVAEGLTSEVGMVSLKDREGNIWVATDTGLDRFHLNSLTAAPLPASFGQYAVASEADGSLLVGTEFDGLYRLASDQLSKVKTGQEKQIPCLYRSPEGKLWIGGIGTLGFLEDGRYMSSSTPPKFGGETQAMATGPDGDLWVQTASKVGIFRLHDGLWSEIPDTRSKGAAVVMASDRAGRVWAGYMTGYLMVFDRAERKSFGPAQGFTMGSVLALYPSEEGTWIGGQHGLDIMSGDRPVELMFAGDTKIEGISGITRTADGTLWLNSLRGILQVPSAEVVQALKDPSHAMQYRLFNYLDGLSGKAPQIRPLPSIVRGVGSTLWFTTTNGVVSIDTEHIQTNSVIPPVSIKDVLVDGVALDPGRPITLTKGAKDLQIDYTALSLSIPERVRFRYKLDGYDKGWQDAGTRRQAFYTHLPPGHYTFQVIACNNDGLWNETGALVPLYLPPTFLQSWYFKALVGILFFAATWLIYLLRMRRETARMQVRLQERLSERERIARELHDTLFQSVEGSLLHLNAITSRLSVEQQAKDQLQQAYGEVDRVMGQARSLVFDLRQPVDAQDIGATIKLFAEEVGALSDAQVEVHIRGPYIELKPLAYNEVLKVIKECIWNSFRHARPKHIKVDIHSSSRVFQVSIVDDGVGIEPTILEKGGRDGHWGLPGIRERAVTLKAKLVIRNRDAGGTEVLLRIKGTEAYRSRGGLFPLALATTLER